MRERPLSPTALACLLDASRAPLRVFRRGYAPNRFGPFYRLDTVARLLRLGLLQARTRNALRTSYAPSRHGEKIIMEEANA